MGDIKFLSMSETLKFTYGSEWGKCKESWDMGWFAGLEELTLMSDFIYI